MARTSEVYGGGTFLNAKDLQGREVALLIAGAAVRKMDDGTSKIVLSFRKTDKVLPLNVTNANTLADILGSDESDHWIGQRIVLFTAKVDFQGRRVDGIRIKAFESAPTPRERQQSRQPPPPPVRSDEDVFPPAAPLTDDDIPF